MTKKLKIKTLRQRILQTVMEIIIGIILVAISIFIITDILAYTNQITSASNQLTITISDKASKNDIIQEMKNIPYDYILYDKNSGKIINQTNVSNDFTNYQKAFETKQIVNASDGVAYINVENTNYSLIVRKPSIPEFANHTLRHISYNSLTYIIFIVGIFLVLIWAITRLLKEFAKNFYHIQNLVLNMGNLALSAPLNSSDIAEFDTILTILSQKSDELAELIEKERNEKKDLSFQIAALAHDVKTPLTVIKGNLELLEMTSLTENQLSFLTSINNSIIVFENYFNAMLTYSRLLSDENNDKETIHLEIFLTELSREIQDILKPTTIQFTLNNQAQCSYFLGNQLNLNRALVNIFVNAVQHAPNGKIRLSVEESDNHLNFKIWNNGAPFSAKALKNADKFFFTENNGRSDKHYGIGLSFAKAVAEKHHGKLTLCNPEKGGAEVVLSISTNSPIRD